jgi:hypothetical protein
MNLLDKMMMTVTVIASTAAAGCGGPPGDGVESVAEEVVVPGVTAPGSGDPGGALFNGLIFMSYVDSNQHIQILREQGDGFVRQVRPHSTRYGASLCVFDGALYLAWIAPDRTVHTERTFDGENWQDERTLPASVPRYADTPAMVSWGAVLNIFVNDKLDLQDSRFWHMHQFWSNDGVTWPEQQITVFSDQASPYGPSAAALENATNDLVVAWEMPSKQELAVRRFVSGSGWSEIFRQPHFGVPQMAAVQEQGQPGPHPLVIVSRGTASVGANNIHFFRSDDGWQFMPIGDSGSVTDRKPGIVSADRVGIVFDFIGLPRSPGGRRLNDEVFFF